MLLEVGLFDATTVAEAIGPLQMASAFSPVGTSFQLVQEISPSHFATWKVATTVNLFGSGTVITFAPIEGMRSATPFAGE